MAHIEISGGRHSADIYYGPKCTHHKTFDSALAWAKEYKEAVAGQVGDSNVVALHYLSERKGTRPLVLDL